MLRWFSKTKKDIIEPIDFSVLKTDIHSHLIPAIDDGSSDMQTTINLIRKMQELGFKKVITTPHVMSDFYQNTSDKILSALDAVRQELKDQSISIEIDAAAEYYIDFEFGKKIGKEQFLTFGENYILVEISFLEEPRNFFEIIFQLQLEGYKVVLAHPERYNFYSIKDLKELKNRGVLLQINLLSLIGYYSLKVQRKTERMIEENLVSFVGTDCHNMDHAALYEQCYSQKYWHELLSKNILLNQTL